MQLIYTKKIIKTNFNYPLQKKEIAMSDIVLVSIIICIAVIVFIIIFHDKLKSFKIKWGKFTIDFEIHKRSCPESEERNGEPTNSESTISNKAVMNICVDYKKERNAFLSLIELNCEKRILLFTGKSGMGKSHLLEACREDVCKSVYFLPFQLRGAAVGISEIFEGVEDLFGRDSLPLFTEKKSELSETNVIVEIIPVKGDELKGYKDNIKYVLQMENKEARTSRQAALTLALFKDLQKLKQNLLIVIDTYEKGASEVKEWISGLFLELAANTKNVRVVIAGQKVPISDTKKWKNCCDLYELKGVRKAKHWLPVVKALNIEVPNLAMICHENDGHPMYIINKIK